MLVEPGLRARSYHSCNSFRRYPTLGKYLKQVLFAHTEWRGCRRRPFPAGGWITFKPLGGSYRPETAIEALNSITERKVTRYGSFGKRRMRLVIYYNKAWAYNTPYLGVNTRNFADVAKITAAKLAGKRIRFERVYLLSTLRPGPEAFEIFPGFAPVKPARSGGQTHRLSRARRGGAQQRPRRE
jgi:hypothetical protein